MGTYRINPLPPAPVPLAPRINARHPSLTLPHPLPPHKGEGSDFASKRETNPRQITHQTATPSVPSLPRTARTFSHAPHSRARPERSNAPYRPSTNAPLPLVGRDGVGGHPTAPARQPVSPIKESNQGETRNRPEPRPNTNHPPTYAPLPFPSPLPPPPRQKPTAKPAPEAIERAAQMTKVRRYHRTFRKPVKSRAQTTRSTIIFLISAIALAGFNPLGQVLAQFMIVWQRYSLNGSSRSSSRSGVASSRLSMIQR